MLPLEPSFTAGCRLPMEAGAVPLDLAYGEDHTASISGSTESFIDILGKSTNESYGWNSPPQSATSGNWRILPLYRLKFFKCH